MFTYQHEEERNAVLATHVDPVSKSDELIKPQFVESHPFLNQKLSDLHNYYGNRVVQRMLNRSHSQKSTLPTKLKTGIEALSNLSMDDVTVHYRSDKPAQVEALAFAQDTDIHLAPGQEKHLPHEAWHVVQQMQGRVKPTMQITGVSINDDTALEREAEVMGARALQMTRSDRVPQGSTSRTPISLQRRKRYSSPFFVPPIKKTDGPNSVIQRIQFDNIENMRSAIAQALNEGEQEVVKNGSALLSRTAKNITELGKLFTLPTGKTETDITRAASLNRQKNNEFYDTRNDKILARITRGAEELMSAVIFWGKDMDKKDGQSSVASVIELMGSDLHERGLGAAKVTYLRNDLNYPRNEITTTIAMIKPEDRSIEQALFGTENSLASNLNKRLPITKRVSTVAMDVNPEHGAISEYVQSGLHEAATWAFRKVRVFYSSDENAIETIALAFLGGIWDLHDENVIMRGGKPVLVDADVAMRPNEFINGPDNQGAFKRNPSALDKFRGNADEHRLTTAVKGQLAGEPAYQGRSIILQYAIDHPEEVIKTLETVVGDKEVRILPLFTADLANGRRMYESIASEKRNPSEELSMLADGVCKGGKDFFGEFKGQGFVGELGVDRGNKWDKPYVMENLKKDFDSAQLPVFSYQPKNGQAFYHRKTVWVGYSIKDSMGALHEKLTQAKKKR